MRRGEQENDAPTRGRRENANGKTHKCPFTHDTRVWFKRQRLRDDIAAASLNNAVAVTREFRPIYFPVRNQTSAINIITANNESHLWHSFAYRNSA